MNDCLTLFKSIYVCSLKLVFLLYFISNIQSELINFIQLFSLHQTVARYFKSSNSNAITV